MDRFLEATASFFLGRKRKKCIDKHKPGIAVNLKSSGQNDLTVDKSQDEKEGKLKDKGKLFVGGLNYATTSRELSAYFSKFGDVINCVVIKCPITGKSRGFGFVSFLNPTDAEKALQIERHVLHGRTIECRPFDSKDDSKETKPKRRTEARVFLGGLPANVTKEELQQFFSRYGKVMNVFIPTDRNTKKGKGFGFISFENEDVAEKCIAERFVYLKERRVFINKADIRDGRPRAEDGISGSYDSTVPDQESLCPEDSASLPDEDTQSSSSGQLNFELEQYPEYQQLFQNYFLEKLTCYSGMSGKEVEKRKEQLQNNNIEKLENFLRSVSLNPRWNLNQVYDSESTNSDTSSGSYEADCEDLTSLLLPQGEFGECVSKNSVGKSTSKATLPFEKERPDLKFSTQEFTEGRHKSSAPMSFKNNTGTFTCYLCEWTSPDLSFENFLAHCKTAAHRTKLMERFSESQTQGFKVEPKVYPNSEKQKDSLSEANFYPKLTGIHLNDWQRQNDAQNAQTCGKMQQTPQYFKQLLEQPLQHQLVEQEVQKVEKVPKKKQQKKKKKKQQEQNELKPVQEPKTERVPNSENKKQTSQIDKQNSHQEIKDKKMNIPNLKIYALAKGMACIQPLSENRLNCEMCNKIIPESSDFDVLMKNVSQHLNSKTHLQKLLETEDKLKSLVSKNLESGKTSSLDNKNSKEESVKKKKKKKTKQPTPEDQASLSTSKASLVEGKAVLVSKKPEPIESKKPEPKCIGVKPQNAVPKKQKDKTDDSRVEILCLQCTFSSSTFEEFRRHLESKWHLSISAPKEPLTVQNPEYTVCNFCNAFLFGSLYEINIHFSECLKEKR